MKKLISSLMEEGKIGGRLEETFFNLKTFFMNSRKFLIITSAFFLLFSSKPGNSNGQEVSNTLPNLPYMWVDKSEADARRDMFANKKLPGHAHSKLEVLNIILKNTHPKNYTISVKDFDQLLTNIESGVKVDQKVIGLRVYFAAYNPKDKPDHPSIRGFMDKQIVLIFAPTDVSSYDLGQYYYIGSDKKSHRFKKKNVDVLPSWVDYYQKQEGEIALVSTLDRGADRGEYGNDPANDPTTDTKSLLYCYLDFQAYTKTERDYHNLVRSQSPNKSPIDSIEIDFASFTVNGGSVAHPGWFKNRLHILFEFKSKGSTVFEEVDDPVNLQTRHNMLKETSKCGFDNKYSMLTGDNSQLCPPYNCPPPGKEK